MIIGIGGYARAGKDATAAILEEQHGFRRTYMAAPLEQALVTLNPMVEVTAAEARFLGEKRWASKPMYSGCVRYASLHEEFGYEMTKAVSDVRGLLQRLGTDVARDMFGEDTWVNLAERKITELSADGSDVVTTGIRYPNELEMIRELGGFLWWIEREGVNPVNGHTSDNTLSRGDFDSVVFNDGLLADLDRAVTRLLARYRRVRGIK